MAKLRGSNDVNSRGIIEALKLSLSVSVNEKQLRKMIAGVIKNLEARRKKIK